MTNPTLIAPAGKQTFRLSVQQYLSLTSVSVGLNSVRTELLDGIIVPKMTRHAPHVFTVLRLGSLLRTVLAGKWVVSEEKPVELEPQWLPEPDIAILLGPDSRYAAALPGAADVVLLIEVADTTYASDRLLKWQKYAAIGIPIYWIVNLSKRQVEVYRQPHAMGAIADYLSCEVFGANEAVPVVIANQQVGLINVADLLP